MPKGFPSDFLWGVATAAYQIEGAVNEDGRGPSIWDNFSHRPGKIAGGDTGDVACDHYHLFPADIASMKSLGINAYRASVSWSRIFPQGTGKPNLAGLDFYQRLVDGLLEASIKPTLTLFHWDLPSRLQELGGWANRDLVWYFRDYADFLFEKLGDRVQQWITINEPAVHTILGHIYAEHAPGISDWKVGLQTAHHLLLSHGYAVKSYRQHNYPGQIGITLNLTHYESASVETPDTDATARLDGLWNRWYLEPLFTAHYPADLEQLFGQKDLNPSIQDEDLNIIATPLDFLGVNYYFREFIKADPQVQIIQASRITPPPPTTAMGWEIYPPGLYKVLNRVKENYADLPLYVTENGAAFTDTLQGDTVYDEARILFLQDHIQQVAQAVQDGINVKGYFLWSLLDNFEWAYGFQKRFGLIYTDYASQKRFWKQSAYWYQKFLQTK